MEKRDGMPPVLESLRFALDRWRIYDFQKEVSNFAKVQLRISWRPEKKSKTKKGCNQFFINISKHSKFNLASSNTPNLTQLTSSYYLED